MSLYFGATRLGLREGEQGDDGRALSASEMRRYEGVEIVNLGIWVIGCELVGVSGAFFTSKAIPTWYRDLRKPTFNPPNWVFGPVWTCLYALMGIAAWLVAGKPNVAPALLAFGIQLVLNFLWSYLFFGQKKLRLAFFELVVLWLSILATAILFAKIDALAAGLLVPYLLWTAFATVLNGAIAKLNPGM